MIGAALFNVLFGAALSFVVAFALVRLVAGSKLRSRHPRLGLFVLTMPFAKAAIELARGIPADAFFWAKQAGAVQEHGAFRLGLGVDQFGVLIRFTLAAIWRGQPHPQSGADLVATLLQRRIGANAPSVLGWTLASIGVVLVLAGVVRRIRASIACRAHARGTITGTRRLGWRSVRIVRSTSWRGVPFAGGLLRPYVCLPLGLALDPSQEEAVIQHELAHLRGFDAILLGACALVKDALWFVPGARWLSRDIARQCEIIADARALARGADPNALASALVRTKELASGEAVLGLGSSVLAHRVTRLLEPPKASRGRLAFVILAVLSIAVLRMTVFGNP